MRDVIAKILSAGPWVRRASLAGLGASLLPSLSFGLGLGDIHIESRLNQPLSARVEVVDVSDDDWRQIRVRVAPRTLLSPGPVHPEILASLTLRAVGGSRDGHFIEVKSAEVLTEPLFDLPVEVAGQSLRVARSYSVLLDPALSEDAAREAPAALVAQAAMGVRGGNTGRRGAEREGAAAAPADAARRADAAANVGTARSAGAARDGGAARGAGAARDAGPAHETLQQTLATMQATISSQNVEIAQLRAQVAARTESAGPRRPSTWVEYPARNAPAAESDAPSGWFSLHAAMFYWIGGAIAGIVVVAFGIVSVLRWRHAKMLREIALNEAARRQSAPKPAVAPTSERDLLAWQSNLRAAQSGKWKQSLEDTFDPTSGASGADSGASETSGATIRHVDLQSEPTVAIEELTQDFEADLESLNASYEAEHLESTAGGMAAWRSQNEMLERDYFSDTEVVEAARHG